MIVPLIVLTLVGVFYAMAQSFSTLVSVAGGWRCAMRVTVNGSHKDCPCAKAFSLPRRSVEDAP